MMTAEFPEPFARHYDGLLKRLKLHGMHVGADAKLTQGAGIR